MDDSQSLETTRAWVFFLFSFSFLILIARFSPFVSIYCFLAPFSRLFLSFNNDIGGSMQVLLIVSFDEGAIGLKVVAFNVIIIIHVMNT